MIATGLVAVSQNCVVEKVGESCERAVDAAFAGGPPVGVLPYEPEVGRGGRAEARIVEEKAPVVEYEAAVEGIPEGQDSKK